MRYIVEKLKKPNNHIDLIKAIDIKKPRIGNVKGIGINAHR
jgi:hypothetical protein